MALFLALGSIFTVAVLLAFLWVGSGWFIVPKRRPLEPRHNEVLKRPSDFGMELEEVDIVLADGVSLHSYIATRSQAPGVAEKTREMSRRLHARGIEIGEESRGTVYLLHGRGGRKEDLLWVAKRLVAANLRCVVYDARAHGKSGGQFCTFGKKEIEDFVSVIDFHEDLFAQRGETSGPVFAFGNSLGASVVLQSLPVEKRISAAVAVAPFADLTEIVIRSAKYKIHEKVPLPLVYGAIQLGGMRAGFEPFAVSPINQVKDSQVPLLLVHGTEDKLIPIEHSRRLLDRTPQGFATLREIPDAFHYNVLAEGGDNLYEEIILFYLNFQKGTGHDPATTSLSELRAGAKG